MMDPVYKALKGEYERQKEEGFAEFVGDEQEKTSVLGPKENRGKQDEIITTAV